MSRALVLVSLTLLATAAVIFDAAGLWNDAMLMIQRRQAELNRALAAAVRTVRDDGPLAAGGLIAVGFLYGIVHAAGPGHGKAVIAAYMLADSRRLRHGLVLAWASSLMQAVTAIVLVLVVVHVFGAAGRDAQPVATVLERVGYALVMAIGAAMLWSAARRLFPRAGHGHGQDHDHDHDHAGCGHAGCGHGHAPPPPDAGSWRRSVAVVASVGVRPCSGALIVLAFGQALGIFAAGVVATLAMAVGTALTVSALAVAAVASRHLALSLVSDRIRWFRHAETALAVTGGVVLLGLGAVLLGASFQPVAAPFR
ncbi:nickel/cobalt transporter [Azospirillum halopraeferens]|uniref:nickel/cobalt transporter n=1 Tax=Azospirillum halopraeferens TaxID=34010 RepID=UPI00054CFCD2|nr:hypothetical protein [Azospirillum halopraeferens]